MLAHHYSGYTMNPSSVYDWTLCPSSDTTRLDHMTFSSSSPDPLTDFDLALQYGNLDHYETVQGLSLQTDTDFGETVAGSIDWDMAPPELPDHAIASYSSPIFDQGKETTPFSNHSAAMYSSQEGVIGLETTEAIQDVLESEYLSGTVQSTYSGLEEGSMLAPAMGDHGKRQYPFDTYVNHTATKRIKLKTQRSQARRAISHLEKVLRTDVTLSAHFKQKFSILLSQMKLVLEGEEFPQNIRPTPPSPHSTASSHAGGTYDGNLSPEPLSSSDPLDPGYRNEDVLETSTTSCPRVFHALETTWLDANSVHLQAGFKPLYECTKQYCKYTAASEVDWRRHEQGEKHWPQERFMCLQCPVATWDLVGNPVCPFCRDPALSLGGVTHIQTHLLQCAVARQEGKTFGRKDHFCKHLRDQHHIGNTSPYARNWVYPVDSGWPRQCGFCGVCFLSWEQRMDHVAQHYQGGAKVKDWVFISARPRDTKSRIPELGSKRHERDDEDDFGNNGRTLGTFPSRRSISGVFVGSRKSNPGSNYKSSPSSSQPVCTDQVSINYESSSDQSMQILSEKPYLHSCPSLLLERYLSDTEEELFVVNAPRPTNNHGTLTTYRPDNWKATPSRNANQTYSLFKAMNTDSGIIPIFGLPGSKKTLIASAYIAKHRNSLPLGIFWVNSKLDCGIKDSLWDIANQMVGENLGQNLKSANFLQDCLRRTFLGIVPGVFGNISDPHDRPEGRPDTRLKEALQQVPQPEVVQHIDIHGLFARPTNEPSHRRGPWSQAEDADLVRLVHTQGALNWVRIAQLIGSRSPKQCRERYHQNLKPSLNHEPISPEEGHQIERLVGEMGKRWAEIARRLRGRSDNAVKNWWNGSMNRRRGLLLRRDSHLISNSFDEQMQPLSYTATESVHIASSAPSLISDNDSLVSFSPNLTASSILDQSSLNSDDLDQKRPRLPVLTFGPFPRLEKSSEEKEKRLSASDLQVLDSSAAEPVLQAFHGNVFSSSNEQGMMFPGAAIDSRKHKVVFHSF